MELSKEKPKNPTNKLLWSNFWGKYFKFKNAWWTDATHTILKKICYHKENRKEEKKERRKKERKSALLKQNNKEEKDPKTALSVSTIKEAWMKNWNPICTKTNHYFTKFLKKHLTVPISYKKWKSWQNARFHAGI